GWLHTVFFGYDGSKASELMQCYAEGSYGLPQSNVMAVSWAWVAQRWYEAEDQTEGAAYAQACELQSRLVLTLTMDERETARSLATEACGLLNASVARFQAALARRGVTL